MLEEDFMLYSSRRVSQYIVLEIEDRPEVVIDRVRQADGSYKWAVRDSMRECFSNTKSGGTWSYESMPSSRPKNWIKRYRFDSLDEAFAAARRGAEIKLKKYRRRIESINKAEADRKAATPD